MTIEKTDGPTGTRADEPASTRPPETDAPGPRTQVNEKLLDATDSGRIVGCDDSRRLSVSLRSS